MPIQPHVNSKYPALQEKKKEIFTSFDCKHPTLLSKTKIQKGAQNVVVLCASSLQFLHGAQ